MKDGKIIFLESGSHKSGLEHIILEHGSEFSQKGISNDKIPDFIVEALRIGKIVGCQGRGVGKPIYETKIKGEIVKVAITVSSNGFIIGVNMAGCVK